VRLVPFNPEDIYKFGADNLVGGGGVMQSMACIPQFCKHIDKKRVN